MKFTAFFFTALAAAAAPQLDKRCRIGYGITPCWIRWDYSECMAYIPTGVTYKFDHANKKIVIDGLCDTCSAALVREEARQREGSWTTTFGRVKDIGNGTFVISDAIEWAMEFMESLPPHPQSWATSCED